MKTLRRIQDTKATVQQRRNHSGVRKFVDAYDDAQFIINQHRDLQESVALIMVDSITYIVGSGFLITIGRLELFWPQKNG
jgi:hypothetical protein